jgi:uncharacterized protein (DUF1810 family)
MNLSKQVESVALTIKNRNLSIKDLVDAHIAGNGIMGAGLFELSQTISNHILGEGLERFRKAQRIECAEALYDILSGNAKDKAYISYIFPQIKGRAGSRLQKFYAVEYIEEAMDYLADPELSANLITLCGALMSIEGKTAEQLFGIDGAARVKASMTLFSKAEHALQLVEKSVIFDSIIDKYFDGKYCELTNHIVSNY